MVFSSDFNRNTLDGSPCERTHSMRANIPLNAPILHLPTTLVSDFRIFGELDGVREEIISVEENRKRYYHLIVRKTYDTLILVPIKGRGEEGTVPVISFDFS